MLIEGSSSLASDDFIPLEAIIDEEVSESVIEVRPQAHETVRLVRVTDLSEEDVSLLQRSAEHHGLLVVDVVIRRAVHHQVLLVGELLGLGGDVTGLVAGQVIITGGQAKIPTKVKWYLMLITIPFSHYKILQCL